MAVAAGPVEIHTTVPAGSGSRVLRLADTADEAWTATLDGKPLTPTTLDGWAQGFELPSSGGKLDVTFDTPIGHTAWLWTQGALALVLVVMALPGRRRDVDDDLPEEEREIPAQAATGDGRRARRLRAQAEADQDGQPEPADQPGEFPADTTPPSEETPAAVPQQQPYGDEWNTAAYAGTQYDGYSADQYQNAQQYPAGTYDPAYQGDPYQNGQYDPYAYGGPPQTTAYDQTYTQGYDPTAYDPAQPPQPHPQGERPDGSQQ